MAAMVVLAFASAAATAQPFPARPIRIVVGFPPGGGSDVIARLVGAALSEELRTPVVIENKAGAGGAIAAEFVAKSPPDGYTLHLATAGPYTIAPTLRKLPYDVDKDLQPVSLLVVYPNFLVATTASGISGVQDLVAKAKASPGKLSFASSGSGATPHLAFEYLNMQAGIRITHVPYKGTTPAITDLLGGQVPLMIGDPGPLLPHIQSGKLKVLAVTTKARSPLFPAIASIAEQGIPGYDVSLWLGLTAPAGLPPEVLTRLVQATEKVLARKEVAEKIVANGMDVSYAGPAEFGKMIKDERARWAGVIKANNITE
jgi:tripartite-type tricarboxylate transporter receptor subunit TctC